jgi:hypothetical protein
MLKPWVGVGLSGFHKVKLVSITIRKTTGLSSGDFPLVEAGKTRPQADFWPQSKPAWSSLDPRVG